MVIEQNIWLANTDKSVTETVRPRSAGNGRAVDTTVVDVGSFGHDVLYGQRRILSGRRSDRSTYTATRSYGTRSLSARRRVERRDRGQSEERIQVDTQLQNTVGENRVFLENAKQH